jgi:hypothetical protein
MTLQFTGQTVALQGKKNTISVVVVTQEIDMPILMMMPEVTLFRVGLIEPGSIGMIKPVLQWLLDQYALVRGSVPLLFHPTSE